MMRLKIPVVMMMNDGDGSLFPVVLMMRLRFISGGVVMSLFPVWFSLGV